MARVVKLSITDLPKAIRKADAAVRAAMLRGIKRGALASKEILEAATPVDTGLMRRSWRIVEAGRQVEIRNDAPYAALVEWGSKPRRLKVEEIASIRRWITRKRRGLAAKLTPEQFRRRIDIAVGFIVTSIQRHGRRPRLFMTKATPACARATQRCVRDELAALETKGVLS